MQKILPKEEARKDFLLAVSASTKKCGHLQRGKRPFCRPAPCLTIFFSGRQDFDFANIPSAMPALLAWRSETHFADLSADHGKIFILLPLLFSEIYDSKSQRKRL